MRSYYMHVGSTTAFQAHRSSYRTEECDACEPLCAVSLHRCWGRRSLAVLAVCLCPSVCGRIQACTCHLHVKWRHCCAIFVLDYGGLSQHNAACEPYDIHDPRSTAPGATAYQELRHTRSRADSAECAVSLRHDAEVSRGDVCCSQCLPTSYRHTPVHTLTYALRPSNIVRYKYDSTAFSY